MRIKPVPSPPDNVETAFDARRAVPLVPKPEADCCARIIGRLHLSSRDEARAWLTFLRGLGIVEETERGFARTRRDVDEAALADGLPNGVFGAREVLSILEAADEPLPEDAVFERFEAHVPQWERHKQPAAWRDAWRARVSNLLGWLVLLELAERRDDGYVPVRSGSSVD